MCVCVCRCVCRCVRVCWCKKSLLCVGGGRRCVKIIIVIMKTCNKTKNDGFWGNILTRVYFPGIRAELKYNNHFLVTARRAHPNKTVPDQPA